MGATLLGAIEQLIRLGNLTLEERHRYEDDLLKLKGKWYEEFSKLESDKGSDNALDDIELKLRLILEALTEAVRAKNS